MPGLSCQNFTSRLHFDAAYANLQNCYAFHTMYFEAVNTKENKYVKRMCISDEVCQHNLKDATVASLCSSK